MTVSSARDKILPADVSEHLEDNELTLVAVFERAGVERAHAHRFRRTLASELLGKGGAHEEIA